ncbi:hypothetical protein G3046_004731 [Salmonella enterica]|nr:hypothetical protein [Salmonella enterica subsp. enterica serovar Montevideo]
MNNLTCFKAYDIRGRLGEELNEDIAWRIGRAYGEYLKPKTIVLGGDVRLTWNTEAVVTAAGGTPVMSKTGHAFIKERMRTEDAIYGGEMSAHHYFRDFAYCDSGMIPWLLVAELVCLKGQSLGELVRDRMAAFPASGEINSRLAEPAAAIARVEAHFAEEAQAVDRTDGLSMSFADWRFNLRSSNTEPVVRLNVESRGDIPLMEARTKEILQLLNS